MKPVPSKLPNERMQTGRLSRTFAFIIARRWYVLACYAMATGCQESLWGKATRRCPQRGVLCEAESHA